MMNVINRVREILGNCFFEKKKQYNKIIIKNMMAVSLVRSERSNRRPITIASLFLVCELITRSADMPKVKKRRSWRLAISMMRSLVVGWSRNSRLRKSASKGRKNFLKKIKSIKLLIQASKI